MTVNSGELGSGLTTIFLETMAKKINIFPDEDSYVTLRESDHRYFSTDGQEWKSWSSVSKQLEEPFYARQISMNSCNGDSVKAEALRREWEDIRDDACDYGHDIHKRMEDYFQDGIVDYELGELQERMHRELFMGYKKLYTERTFYMRWPVPGSNGKEFRNYAGQSDIPALRRNDVLDIFDYKTNKRNGIRFNSDWTDKKTGLLMPGKKMLLSPLDHLEKCEYNKYALQLSAYALMAQMTYGTTIGRLGEIYIFKNAQGEWDYELYPVPYMKLEVMALYDFDASLKPLNQPF